MAKFYPPRIPRAVSRVRLFSRLDAALATGAAWIQGGAGAGKTTLIASYLQHSKRLAQTFQTPVAHTLWCEIDASDGDVAVCCHSLQQSASLKSPPSTLGFPPLESLRHEDLAAFLRTFFRAFYSRLPAPCVLVLDNAQEALASVGFRALLQIALEEAPPGLRWLIASRLEAPAEVARLRANGHLAVLAAHELPFTEDESFAVQRQFHLHREWIEKTAQPERPSIEQMGTLHQWSRGWPAGLSLLLQLAPSERAVLQDSGAPLSDSALFDYLAREVFARLETPVQDLLLQLAHLPRIGADMAEALCATPAAIEVLSQMAQDGLLTTQHLGTQKIPHAHYEFHPLLRRFLVQHAQHRFPPVELARIERTAAGLLAAASELDAAAQLLIAGRHWPELELLVHEHAPLLVGHGWQQTLSGWLQALPPQRRDDDPWLTYWQGEATLHVDPPAAQESLARAYRLFRQRHDGAGAFRAWCASVDLVCLEWADFSPLDFWLDEVPSLHIEFGAPDAALVPRYTASTFSALMFRRPHDPAIHAWAERLLAVIEACPEDNTRLLLGCNLQMYHTVVVGRKAQLTRMMATLQPRDEAALVPIFAVLWQALKAMYAWSEARIQDSAEAGAQGYRLAREHGLRMWDFFLGALEIYARVSDGELEHSRSALRRLEECLEERRKVDLSHFHFLSALVAISARDGATALLAVSRAESIASRYGGPHQMVLCALAQAEALHLCGRTEESWPLLAQARESGEAFRSPMLLYQVGLSEAWLAIETNDEERCAKALRGAFAIGAEQDYLNHHCFRPAHMSHLCAFALAHGIEANYARRLIRGRRLPPPENAPAQWPWPVRVETLSRFGVRIDDDIVTLNRGLPVKPLQLLKVLIALGGRDVPITAVVAALWNEEQAHAAQPAVPRRTSATEGRRVFDTTLSRLRQLLRQPDALHVCDGRLTLNPQRCWVDLWQLQRLLGDARTTLGEAGTPLAERAADVSDRLAAHGRALFAFAPWEFLPADRDAPWARDARADLGMKVVAVLADLATVLCARGFRKEAEALFQEAVAVDPTREPLYREWMRCLFQHGERAEALRVYRLCCDALARELQTTPSPQTEALRAEILSETKPPPNTP